MEQLTIKVPDAPPRAVELPPGVHKVGRSEAADLQIDHPSVSSAHCELTVNNSTISVRDLNSTNGTLFNGSHVLECQITPGQTLRLGEVEITYGAPATARAKAPVRLAIPPPEERAAAPGPSLPPPSFRETVPARPRRPRQFFQNIPGAFIYPFRRNGLMLLIVGTLIFGLFDFLLTIRFGGLFLLGGVAAFFASGITGYLFLFMRSIITSSAQGDESIPSWPEYEGWFDSAFLPYLQLVALMAACVMPSILCLAYLGGAGRILALPVLILGIIYGPMALLAVAIDDSWMGLNPLLVFPAIVRVPLEYLVTFILFGALFFLLVFLGVLADLRLPPLARQIMSMFFSLYLTIVQMRLLGLLYYCKRERIGWERV